MTVGARRLSEPELMDLKLPEFCKFFKRRSPPNIFSTYVIRLAGTFGLPRLSFPKARTITHLGFICKIRYLFCF